VQLEEEAEEDDLLAEEGEAEQDRPQESQEPPPQEAEGVLVAVEGAEPQEESGGEGVEAQLASGLDEEDPPEVEAVEGEGDSSEKRRTER